MTNQRSLMEQVNVNRARRDATSLDSLNRTLEALESQLRNAMKPEIQEESQDIADRFAALASRAGQPASPRRGAVQSASTSASQRTDGKHDLSAIAAQLKQLREEMRDEMEAPGPGRFEPHGEAMNRLRQSAASDGVMNRGHTESGHLSMLRGDLNELKRTVDTLAREESVKSLGNRWDAMDDRFDAFAQRHPGGAGDANASLASLEERLDEIRQAMDVLPHSLQLTNVEDKLKLLAGAVEQMARKNGSSLPARFMQQVDERLDEISRAIVATSRPVTAQYDAFERLEARIAALASRFEEASNDRTTDTMLQRMGELAQRVDHLTEQHAAPALNLDVLSEQLSAVTRHLQNAPASISISDFRDLEDRVLQIIHKLETMPQPAADPAFIEKIDQRFEELTRRLDDHHMLTEHSDIRLTDNLEARFDDMARYIAQNVPQVDGTQDAIRNLERQIAGLAEHLSQSNDRHAEMAAIPTRLEAIEESIAASRDLVVEAARNAAAEAIRNTANFGSTQDNTIARELADDLKTLEMLARKSEERNTKTFEAIHDTLLKIVDRLASLESSPARQPQEATTGTTFITDEPAMKATLAYDPAIDVEPVFDAPIFSKVEQPSPALSVDAEISEDAPRERKSLFGGLTRGLKGRSKPEAAPLDPSMETAEEAEKSDIKVELDPDILNRPLEPGSGMPDLNSILKRVRDDRRETSLAGDASAGKADFITAARRAAQAAASEVESQRRSTAVVSDKADAGAKGNLISRQRKPILLAIGAIMIAIAGLQLKNALQDHPAGLDIAVPQSRVTTPEQGPSDPQAATSAAPKTAQPAESAGAKEPVAPAENNASRELAASQPAPDSVESVIATQQNTPPTIEATSTGPSTATETVPGLPAIPAEAGPEPLREAAAKGDSKALFEIGGRYMDGQGVTSDYAKAAEWYNLAAERGYAPAQYRIGNFYEKGIGVTRDLAKAKTYYQLAAEQGNASAMHNLAVLFAAGTDGAPDNESAARWFTKAAELGVKDSQFNLAILSAKGMGVSQNLEESYKWFALAANAGDKDAAQKRDEVAKAMAPDQVERARAATSLWKPKPMNPDANALNVPEEWRETPAAAGSVTTGSLDMKKAIRNVQLILNKNGYDAGGSDGRIGAKTRDAIMAFQKDNGLKPTGNIDNDLVRNLLLKNTQS